MTANDEQKIALMRLLPIVDGSPKRSTPFTYCDHVYLAITIFNIKYRKSTKMLILRVQVRARIHSRRRAKNKTKHRLPVPTRPTYNELHQSDIVSLFSLFWLLHKTKLIHCTSIQPMPSSSAKRSRKDAKKRRDKKTQQQRGKTKSSSASPPDNTAMPNATRKSSRLSAKKRKSHAGNTASSGHHTSSDSDSSSSTSSSSSSSEEDIVIPKKIQRAHAVYYKVKLHSPGGKSPMKIMRTILRSWFKAMKACSPTFVVYEYRNNAKTKAIQAKQDINENIHFLKIFFSGLRLKTVAGDVWFTILAGFDENEEEFKENTDWWFRDNNSGLFKLPIQAPDTVRDIWLFLSHEKIDLSNCKMPSNAKLPVAP